ncbi:MT-A70 family methyltransferase [Roseospira marina]|uniref:MT-A70 family methyltransferase n=1 Tax=Roseospira marina TaxID=140057 RepID=UPI0017FEDF9B|nr:MT-A70 family methyltransferase [Roseospira marina]MBB4314035.1 N6-adenosine-specific RNA methylase IME4 [Roseospira marina]MBB5087196.1 N6-adenosine-specific RNA methylase IME4 [Roseospira marina]
MTQPQAPSSSSSSPPGSRSSAPVAAPPDPAAELRALAEQGRFATLLADPPWRFTNRTGKMAPEHRRLTRYGTLDTPAIAALPVADLTVEPAHCYLWVPNALLPDGLAVLAAWGFTYKTNLIWHKVRRDGGSDGRGVGFYFRNVTEMVLFGVRGRHARTLAPARRQVNLFASLKQEHSRKPDALYELIEACSPGPRLELFARGVRPGWVSWGNQAHDAYRPDWATYANHSGAAPSDASQKGAPQKAPPHNGANASEGPGTALTHDNAVRPDP